MRYRSRGVGYSEWIVLCFFAWLVVASWARALSWERRWQTTIAGLLACAGVVVVARTVPLYARNWAPALYVLVGYFLSGRLFAAPSPRLEQWLAAWDRRLLGDPRTRFAGWPLWLLAYLDIVYVFCFLLVPAGFAALAWTGHAALADRYWTMVVAAEFGAFAPLAIVQTRPPWAIERPLEFRDRSVHRLASAFVRHGTIGANTFPSGHVAGSLAVAFAVVGSVPLIGALLLMLAISISIGCVVGRYHYTIDAVAGAALALFIWASVSAYW